MAETCGIIPSFSNISIACRGGGWDEQQGGVDAAGWVGREVAKIPIWDTLDKLDT